MKVPAIEAALHKACQRWYRGMTTWDDELDYLRFVAPYRVWDRVVIQYPNVADYAATH